MKLSGSDIVMEVLLEHGVDTVFGYPGGAALNIYNSLYEYQDKIKHIITAHEQGASHAADGYARASGKTGVVISTSGPGATNLITGIATAFLDSVPMVAITCNVGDSLIGKDSFQEIYITGCTLPVTKHNFFVNDIKNLALNLRKAFKIANEGRKGPVHIDITKDVTAALFEYQKEVPIKTKKTIVDDLEVFDFSEIIEVFKVSKKPVIYFGGGLMASGAKNELDTLMKKYQIPATYTIMSAGVLDYSDPLNLGMVGMHGTEMANRAIHEADLVLALGARFDDRVAQSPSKFAMRACIIHVDIDASEINKNVNINYPIINDVKKVLNKLLPLLPETEHQEWLSYLSGFRKHIEVDLEDSLIRPKDIIDTVCDNIDKEAIYVTDVGQHQMWAAQYVKHKRCNAFLTSGGLGTMGFGLGAAIGAQFAKPDDRVIHFTGDGSFHMNLNEGCTEATYNLPIITIIFDNKVLGMVYQWQTVFYNSQYSETDLKRKTDYSKLAAGFGIKGYNCKTLEEFKLAYQEALLIDGPVWIACEVSKNERVLPMIPSGKTVDDMICE